MTESNVASGCPAGLPGEGAKLHPRMEPRLWSLGDHGVDPDTASYQLVIS